MLRQLNRASLSIRRIPCGNAAVPMLSVNPFRTFTTIRSPFITTKRPIIEKTLPEMKYYLQTLGSIPLVQLRAFSNDLPPHRLLEMPALSPSMEKGNITKWNKNEGDEVKSGDVIAEIETDKATMDWEATDDGFLAKILVPGGSKDVSIGQPIAVIVDSKDEVSAFANFSLEGKKEEPKSEAPKKEERKPEPQPTAPKTATKEEVVASSMQGVPGAPPSLDQIPLPKSGIFASPLAKATAAQTGVNLKEVSGSGPNGRIIQQDVLERSSQTTTQTKTTATAQPRAGQQYTDTPTSQIRKITAQRLSLSKQTIPHYYLTVEIRVDELLKVRKKLNDQSNGSYKLSVNDFLIKASALANKKVPIVNSSWHDEFIRTYDNVDINVAVNTDKGLFTPVVRDADKIGLVSISETVRNLAAKAKENKLHPNDYEGGTFTISNLGMFGIKTFSAVINPPQACILAVGGTEEKVIVDPNSTNPENPFTTANVISVTLSCDHRIVDGAIGAQWLQEFKKLMEDPLRLLL